MNTSSRPMPLLATKLFIPRPRPDLVPRPRLLAQLEAGLRGPLTVLVAPAGWGKTSLLSEWRACEREDSERPRPVAWVSLDAGDNDSIRFWTYALSALNATCPGLASEALAQLRSPQPPPIEVILTLLLNDLATLETDAVLVLDDYHVIEAEATHEAVAFLLDHLPPRFHLVLATRQDPPLPLSRRRAQGLVTELRVADLRFTSEETGAFLTTTLGLTLTSEAVHALESRSEGWIAGLQLAALSMQGRSSDQAETFIAEFTGSNRYIVDYMVEEALARQPPELQTFLLRTAVVDRFCAPLCERLLADDGVDSQDPTSDQVAAPARPRAEATNVQPPTAQALMESVERANLFLIPLDDQRRWYRYHHLFADVLRSRLRQLDPELPAELRRRASVWCEEEGLLEEAIEYALAAADFERAADLIERRLGGIAVLRAGRYETGLGWMRALPDSLIRSRPLLSAIFAVLLMYAGQMDAVPARLGDAEAALGAQAPAAAGIDGGSPLTQSSDELSVLAGIVAIAQATVPLFSGDLDKAAPLIRRGLDLVPDSEIVWRAGGLSLATYAYQLSGEATPAAERKAEAALAAVHGAGDLAILLPSGITNLAHIYLMQGRLRRAAATLEQIPTLVSPISLGGLPGSHGYHAALGEILREWNDLDASERHLKRSLEGLGSRIVIPADVVALGYLGLARVQQARGEYGAALETLDAFAEVARQRGFVPELVERGAAVRAQVELCAGNLAAAERWAEASGLAVGAAALPFRREPAYLVLTRMRIAQGHSEPGGPFLQEALDLLERLRREAATQGRGRSALEIAVLRALALQARRDTRGALGALAHALTQAQPEGYMRLFADEGAPMAALLTALLDAAESRRVALPPAVLDYTQRLLAVCRSQGGAPASRPPARSEDAASAADLAPSTSSVSPLLDPLTERELEVLRLLAEGASNAAIAGALVVTVGTVKKHVFNVCGKLGARNRTQAVARARALRLL